MMDLQRWSLVFVAIGFAALAWAAVPSQSMRTVHIERQGRSVIAALSANDARLSRLATIGGPPKSEPKWALARFRSSSAAAYSKDPSSALWQTFWLDRHRRLEQSIDVYRQKHRFDTGTVTIGGVVERPRRLAWWAAVVAALATVVIGQATCDQWPVRRLAGLAQPPGLAMDSLDEVDFSIEQPSAVWIRRAIGAAGVLVGPLAVAVRLV